MSVCCCTYRKFPHHFDESKLFQGEASQLKEEFRLKFLNISRIMDCVGCDKCKLWGKVQVRRPYLYDPVKMICMCVRIGGAMVLENDYKLFLVMRYFTGADSKFSSSLLQCGLSDSLRSPERHDQAVFFSCHKLCYRHPVWSLCQDLKRPDHIHRNVIT